MIEVVNLQKNYGEKAAVKGISFKVGKGECFGFLGPNGAGKTTTIKILTGQLLPSYGEARILDRDVVRQKTDIQKSLGIVPERTNLYERLSVGQNLEFFCRLYGCEFKNIDLYLEKVRLSKEKNTQVKKLSKGMKQKVLLIRALLHKPELIFLDEPTSGLDPASASDIHSLLMELNREGMTIFITSHNMEEVDKLCNRVAFLNAGTIAAMGTPQELKLRYSDNRVRVMVKENSELKEHILEMDGDESARSVAEWMRAGLLKSIHSCEPTLADIFNKVTGRELV